MDTLLQEFDLQIRDKKRTDNLVADHMSCLPNAPSSNMPVNEHSSDEQHFWRSQGSSTLSIMWWQRRYLQTGQDSTSTNFILNWNTSIGMIFICENIIQTKSSGDVSPKKSREACCHSVMTKLAGDTLGLGRLWIRSYSVDFIDLPYSKMLTSFISAALIANMWVEPRRETWCHYNWFYLLKYLMRGASTVWDRFRTHMKISTYWWQ